MPEAEQLSVVELLNATVFAVSPESVMFTFDGGAARQVVNIDTSKPQQSLHYNQLLCNNTAKLCIHGHNVIFHNIATEMCLCLIISDTVTLSQYMQCM